MTRKLNPARNHSAVAGDQPGLELSSLVDVSFLLLVFFLATSTLRPVESDLNMGMAPSMTGGGITILDHADIRLLANGSITLNEEILDTDPAQRALPLLTERLQALKSAEQVMADSVKVNLFAQDEARGQRYIDIINCLTSLGISEVTVHN